MWFLVIGLMFCLLVVAGAYMALYADDFDYQGKHRGQFNFWKGEAEQTVRFVGILTPSQGEL
jgi:hypothetical protein